MAKEPTLWKETLWYNCMRAGFAGLIWSVVLVAGGSSPSYLILGPPMFALFMYPVFGITTALFMAFFGPVGLFAGAFAAMFMVSVGDPFVYALSKIKPEWVPVEKPSIFSLILLKRVSVPPSKKRYAIVEIAE